MVAGGPLKRSVRLSGAVLREDTNALLLAHVSWLSTRIRSPRLLLLPWRNAESCSNPNLRDGHRVRPSRDCDGCISIFERN
jgi:hypothetical protein